MPACCDCSLVQAMQRPTRCTLCEKKIEEYVHSMHVFSRPSGSEDRVIDDVYMQKPSIFTEELPMLNTTKMREMLIFRRYSHILPDGYFLQVDDVTRRVNAMTNKERDTLFHLAEVKHEEARCILFRSRLEFKFENQPQSLHKSLYVLTSQYKQGSALAYSTGGPVYFQEQQRKHVIEEDLTRMHDRLIETSSYVPYDGQGMSFLRMHRCIMDSVRNAVVDSSIIRRVLGVATIDGAFLFLTILYYGARKDVSDVGYITVRPPVMTGPMSECTVNRLMRALIMQGESCVALVNYYNYITFGNDPAFPHRDIVINVRWPMTFSMPGISGYRVACATIYGMLMAPSGLPKLPSLTITFMTHKRKLNLFEISWRAMANFVLYTRIKGSNEVEEDETIDESDTDETHDRVRSFYKLSMMSSAKRCKQQ